jgi:YbbR domain-containing protein
MKNALDVIKRILERLGQSLRHNWGYKVLALGIAIMLWALVMAEANPLRERTLSDVPIRLENLETLQNMGFTLAQPAKDLVYTAQVRLEVPRQDVDLLSAASVRLSLDLSQITSTGIHMVPVIATSSLGNVIRTDPSQIKLEVDTWASRIVPVEVVQDGQVQDGFWTGTPSASPGVIQVRGPESQISRVSKARVTLAVADLTQDYTAAHSYTLLDEQNQPVDGAALAYSDSEVIVNMQVRPTKQVPIKVAESITGTDSLPKGYEVAGIDVYPDSVTIAGLQSTLSSVDSLEIGMIDVSGATADVRATSTLKVPDGVRLLEQSTVEVIVRIREVQSEVVFENLPVEVRDLPKGLKIANFNQRVTVTLTGPSRTMKGLSPSNVHVYIDLINLTAGTQTVKIYAELDEAYADWEVKLDIESVEIRLDKS